MSTINSATTSGELEEAVHGHGVHPELRFVRKYVFSTNHKMIGKQYMLTSVFFLFVGGFLAMLMRWQLAFPWEPIPRRSQRRDWQQRQPRRH